MSLLRYLAAGQRLAHDAVDYPDRGKRIYRNQDMIWDLVDISAIDHPTAGRKFKSGMVMQAQARITIQAVSGVQGYSKPWEKIRSLPSGQIF